MINLVSMMFLNICSLMAAPCLQTNALEVSGLIQVLPPFVEIYIMATAASMQVFPLTHLSGVFFGSDFTNVKTCRLYLSLWGLGLTLTLRRKPQLGIRETYNQE